MSEPRDTVTETLAPWAKVYLCLMARMPGGMKARAAVVRFVSLRGFIRVR